ncbi:hemopexin repeat-containing protein [Streptomyces mayteni]
MDSDVQEGFYRRVDAVLRSRDNGDIAWFFKDTQYLRHELAADKGVSDAALNRRNLPDVGYLFKDDQYVRYDLAADRAETGYLEPIRSNWPFFP